MAPVLAGKRGLHPELAGRLVYQDMERAECMHVCSYTDAWLPAQETCVHLFHEVLNGWLEGGRH